MCTVEQGGKKPAQGPGGNAFCENCARKAKKPHLYSSRMPMAMQWDVLSAPPQCKHSIPTGAGPGKCSLYSVYLST